METSVEAEVRAVLAAHARLAGDPAGLDLHDDLYASGMTSHSTVNVMLGLEDAFDIEFPERMLRKATFGTISAISEAVAELRTGIQ
ncbi:MAG: acyl carrier protein [Actinomycetota bacterium]